MLTAEIASVDGKAEHDLAAESEGREFDEIATRTLATISTPVFILKSQRIRRRCAPDPAAQNYGRMDKAR